MQVGPASDEEFEGMAHEAFEALALEEIGSPAICSRAVEPTADHPLTVTGSVTRSNPSVSTPPAPQLVVKNKWIRDMPARNTRGKTMNPTKNTRSRKRI